MKKTVRKLIVLAAAVLMAFGCAFSAAVVSFTEIPPYAPAE